MILSVTLNPCVDHVLFVDGLKPHDANRVVRAERDAGGKGVNLSRVVAELGGATCATGLLGGPTGEYVKLVLERQGVPHDFVACAGETRTNFSVEDGSGQPPTSFNQSGPEITPQEWAALLAKLDALLKGADWVALAGSFPPGVPPDAYRLIANMARERNCKVMLDADLEALRLGLEAVPHFIKPNEPEASRLLGRPVDSEASALDAARELLPLVDPSGFVVVSRGKDGAVLASAGELYVGISPSVVVKSTVGSGDSMVGAMLWAIREGKPLSEAFRWGLAAGAATASTDGSEIARKPVIERLYETAVVRPV
jgi:1-phosphofructokinase family hexose kinase